MSCACPRSHKGKYLDVEFKGAVIVHLPECTKGAGLTGGEWSTSESQQEGRDAADEARVADYQAIKERKARE